MKGAGASRAEERMETAERVDVSRESIPIDGDHAAKANQESTIRAATLRRRIDELESQLIQNGDDEKALSDWAKSVPYLYAQGSANPKTLIAELLQQSKLKLDAAERRREVAAENGNREPQGAARQRLFDRFADRISTNPGLTRKLVSYQGNKDVPGLRWMKYKEGFSAELVRSLLLQTEANTFLDPFSGSGTAPLTASSLGMDSVGIEIMPIGNLSARSILAAANGLDMEDFAQVSDQLLHAINLDDYDPGFRFQHVPITERAFPEQTEQDIAKARRFISEIADEAIQTLLTLACVSILEEVSYTRKDGQFLRWDPQSGRKVSKKLHKPFLPSVAQALKGRLAEIRVDVPVLRRKYGGGVAEFREGSSLTELRKLPDASVDAVVTSPPYANRYDYSRTYALELAYLGYGPDRLKDLRQSLLSATVENRSKKESLLREYGESDIAAKAFHMADNQAALQEALRILQRESHKLSNRNVITLVNNYFTEMALIIGEIARLVTPGGTVFMVNDNVRYHGQEIPVDLILSDFAEQSGFKCEAIWTLNRGKGNSSQQMGRFGRQEMRKCVYIWKKLNG